MAPFSNSIAIIEHQRPTMDLELTSVKIYLRDLYRILKSMAFVIVTEDDRKKETSINNFADSLLGILVEDVETNDRIEASVSDFVDKMLRPRINEIAKYITTREMQGPIVDEVFKVINQILSDLADDLIQPVIEDLDRSLASEVGSHESF